MVDSCNRHCSLFILRGLEGRGGEFLRLVFRACFGLGFRFGGCSRDFGGRVLLTVCVCEWLRFLDVGFLGLFWAQKRSKLCRVP